MQTIFHSNQQQQQQPMSSQEERIAYQLRFLYLTREEILNHYCDQISMNGNLETCYERDVYNRWACNGCKQERARRYDEMIREQDKRKKQEEERRKIIPMDFYRLLHLFQIFEQEKINKVKEIFDYCGTNYEMAKDEIIEELGLNPEDYEQDEEELNDEVSIVCGKRRREPEPAEEPEPPAKVQRVEPQNTELCDALSEAIERVYYFSNLKSKGKSYKNVKIIVSDPLPPPINNF